MGTTSAREGGVRRRRRLLRGAVAAAVAVAASACVLSFQRPTVRVAEVHLAALGISGGTVTVAVEVANPNDYALEGTAFQYHLAFSDGADSEGDWVTLSEGRHDERISVPANDTALVELDLPFQMGAVSGALGRLLRRGELDYRFTGELFVTEPRRVAVPFDRRGVFRP